MFDVVSTQFAIHYMFEKEEKLRSFFRNVTDRLEDGGVFIGTTIDSDRLVHKIRQSKDLTIGNDFYQIVFGQDTFTSSFGLKYYFYLEGAIGQKQISDGKPRLVPEFLVCWDILEKIAAEYGLTLMFRMNFHEYFAQQTSESSRGATFNQ